jgi:hypothetical protein
VAGAGTDVLLSMGPVMVPSGEPGTCFCLCTGRMMLV